MLNISIVSVSICTKICKEIDVVVVHAVIRKNMSDYDNS